MILPPGWGQNLDERWEEIGESGLLVILSLPWQADEAGNLAWRPATIGRLACPYRPIEAAVVVRAVEALVAEGEALLYEADGRTWLHLPAIQRANAGKQHVVTTCPLPPHLEEARDGRRRRVLERSRTDAKALQERSRTLQERSANVLDEKREKGREDGSSSSLPSNPPLPPKPESPTAGDDDDDPPSTPTHARHVLSTLRAYLPQLATEANAAALARAGPLPLCSEAIKRAAERAPTEPRSIGYVLATLEDLEARRRERPPARAQPAEPVRCPSCGGTGREVIGTVEFACAVCGGGGYVGGPKGVHAADVAARA